jgi:purine-nucleoside phosphorylase
LWGPLPPEAPSRFTDLTEVYSRRLRGLARELDPSLAEGVYANVPGPHFETPAEIRMLRTAGASLVGMSTVMEAIAARHLGAEVLGISMVSNPAAGLSDAPINHQDVLAATAGSAATVGTLLGELLPRL